MSADRINKLRAGLAAQNLIEGLGGVRIEDDVVATADAGRSLTSFERELIMLAEQR